ncbi:Uncharacterised protein [Raoultella planticola]|nr:Uncharacterised protein [Raoultella planticola]
MRRFAGHGRQLFVTDRIQLRQPSLLQQAHKAVVPDGIERIERVLVLDKLFRRANDPLLAQFPLVRRQLFAAAQQPVAHMGIGFRQFRHRRLMRQSAGAED